MFQYTGAILRLFPILNNDNMLALQSDIRFKTFCVNEWVNNIYVQNHIDLG